MLDYLRQIAVAPRPKLPCNFFVVFTFPGGSQVSTLTAKAASIPVQKKAKDKPDVETKDADNMEGRGMFGHEVLAIGFVFSSLFLCFPDMLKALMKQGSKSASAKKVGPAVGWEFFGPHVGARNCRVAVTVVEPLLVMAGECESQY
jgi:hypothetical protein